MSKKKGIAGAMLSVSGIVLFSKVLGFVKQMVTANAFGATLKTDIISLSQGIVTDMDYIVAQALITAFIPTYIYLKTQEEGEERRFVSNTIIVFLTFAGAISVLLVLLSGLLAKIIAPSYAPAESAELAKYIRIVAPLFAFIVQLAIYNALLKANEHFIPGEFIGFNQSVILIILVFLFGRQFGPDTLIVGFYVYSFFNLGYLMAFSRQLWSIERENPFSDPNVKKLLFMMGPLLLGYSMVFINQQVDKIIVSGLGEGTVTAMSYAAVLSNFIGTFIGSISGVLFTYITQNIADNRDKDAAHLTVNSTIQIGTLLLPISIIVVMNASDIVTIVFGRGKFDAVAVQSCSMALIGYGCMFVPFVVRELFSRFQYAYGDSKRPMINSTIAIAFNIVFSIILSRIMGVLGVTLATSFSVLICGVLNIISSRKKNHDISMLGYVRNYPRWILGVAVCFGTSFLCKKTLVSVHPVLRFATVTVITIAIYGIIVYPIIMPLIKRIIHKR